MNHLKWMGHASTIYDIQKSLHEEQHDCDVTLVAKGSSVRAHRFILTSCSDLLRSLLADVPLGQETTIIIPDIKGNLLESVLSFVYLGETSLTSTNLTEFLEAINVLGIKSAISFECNTAALSAGAVETCDIPGKTISEIQVGQDELMEHEHIENDKNENQTIINEHARSSDLEFLNVYNETPHKITYSIEHVPGSNDNEAFILTNNTATFTLASNTKMEQSDKMVEADDDDGQIIEEYSNEDEAVIEIGKNKDDEEFETMIETTTVKPHGKRMRHKLSNANISHHLHESVTTLDSSGDPISVLSSSLDDTYEAVNQTTSHNHEDAIELAVQDVINEGLSLQKAAIKHDISKTVLWRRVRKHPNYMKTARENPVLSLAYERLKSGEPLKNISRELEIPMSTLHRHKVRLVQQGRLPEHIGFKKRESNSKDELKLKLSKAVHACVHEGMSQNHAANLFDIPKSTLWRHLQKRVADAQRTLVDDVKEEVILS